MDGVRLGRVLRAIRRRSGQRQVDLAAKAGVSQSAISRLESGRLDGITVGALDRLVAGLGATLRLDVRWRGGEADRLIDREHADLVEKVARLLRRAGWTVIVEFGFNQFGERGSVDIVAWHAIERALLIVEVKSRLTNLQDLFAGLARKLRIVPALIGRESGWDARHIARLVVLPGTTANRSIVARHGASFESVLPARALEIRRWLVKPSSSIAGVWFLSPIRDVHAKRVLRVRRPRVARGVPGS